MCGIWAYINKSNIDLKTLSELKSKYLNIKGRGPENENYFLANDNTIFGFHRLCIVDVSCVSF